MRRLITQVPSASDELVELADWVEFRTLTAPSRSTSRADLIGALRTSSTVEAVEDLDDLDDKRVAVDAGSQVSQTLADDVFSVLETRRSACGDAARYPFAINNGLISAPTEADSSLYVFLLLLTWSEPTAGHDGTAVVFEEIASHSAHGLLGGTGNAAHARRVGAPRKPPLSRFSEQIDELCMRIGEGDGIRPGEGSHLGDGQLDVVAWRDFPDGKPGKVILFGQCAAGASTWENKLTELDVMGFVGKFMRDRPLVFPVRLFFVPCDIPTAAWRNAVIDSGLVLDRCRMVACANTIDPSLMSRITKFNSELLKDIGAGPKKKRKKKSPRKRPAAGKRKAA